jgi:Fe-S-cluster containining protein
MELLTLFDIVLGLAIIYFIFIHEYVLARKKYKCIRCGKCCKLRVDLSEEDINKIKKAGYKDFLTKDNNLKKINGYCLFMTLDNGITSCKLEKSGKPSICRNFPEKRGIFGKAYDYRCRSFWKFKNKSV